MPSRQRLLVPSMLWPPSRALMLTPFSFCRLPTGTTRLELVTSGRSVAISSFAVGQESARASIALGRAKTDKTQNWRRKFCRLTTNPMEGARTNPALGFGPAGAMFYSRLIRIANDVADRLREPSCFAGIVLKTRETQTFSTGAG